MTKKIKIRLLLMKFQIVRFTHKISQDPPKKAKPRVLATYPKLFTL